jgi:hypothetical protein
MLLGTHPSCHMHECQHQLLPTHVRVQEPIETRDDLPFVVEDLQVHGRHIITPLRHDDQWNQLKKKKKRKKKNR